MRTFVGALVVVAALGTAARAAEPFRVIYPKQDRQVAAALAGPVAEPVYSGDFRDVVQEIAQGHRVNVILDETALTEAGIDGDVLVEADVEGRDLGSALDKLLEPHDLTYLVQDGAVKITTSEAAAAVTLIRSYDVGPLLEPGASAEELAAAVSRLVQAYAAGERGVGQLGGRDASDLVIPIEPQAKRRPGVIPPAEIVPYRRTLVVVGNAGHHERVAKVLGMLGEVVGE